MYFPSVQGQVYRVKISYILYVNTVCYIKNETLVEGRPSWLLLADVGSEVSEWQGSSEVSDGVHLGFQSLGSCSLKCSLAWPPAT